MTFLAGLLCFFGLSRTSLSLDEVSSISISENWTQMWRFFWYQEGNMWSYYILLHFWMLLVGQREFAVRVLSAFIGICTIPIFFLFAKDTQSKSIANIATPLFIFNLYFIFFSQTARGYSLGLFFIVLSSYLWSRFLKTNKNILLVLYAVVAILAIYTHLLTGFVIATQYLALFFLPKNIPWKKIILTTCFILLGILPLIISPAFHGHQLDWLEKPPPIHFIMGFLMLSGDSIFAALLMCCLIAWLIWNKREIIVKKSWERFNFIWLSLWGAFPIAFAFIFSLMVKPIYRPDSFNICLPGFILLVAIALNQLRHRKTLFYLLLGSILFFSAIRLVSWYSGDPIQQIVIENNSPRNWRYIAHYIDEHEQENDIIIFYAYYINNPFSYYFSKFGDIDGKKDNVHTLEISSSQYDLGGGTTIPQPDFTVLDNLSKKYDRVWLVLSYNDFSWLNRRNQWEETEAELHKYYQETQNLKFNQVQVKLLEKR